MQEVIHCQKRYKLRNCYRQYKYGSEYRPSYNPLFIDEQCQQYPGKITAYCGAECPNKRPAENGEKRSCNLCTRKDFTEHFKADPIEQ